MGAYSDILRTLATTGQRFVVPTHLSAMKGIAARPKDHDDIAALLRIDPSSEGMMTRSDSRAEPNGWGSWADAERWRAEEFAARSPVARLAWLDDLWRLASLAMSKAPGDASSPAAKPKAGRR